MCECHLGKSGGAVAREIEECPWSSYHQLTLSLPYCFVCGYLFNFLLGFFFLVVMLGGGGV